MDAKTTKWLEDHPNEARALSTFTEQMAHELMANSAKGSREDWIRRGARDGINELHWHAAKLSVAVKDLEYGEHADVVEEAVQEFAADVAVCALMVADSSGVLSITEDA
ncbi:MAG: hypothetical protein J0H98_07275 [Solirubrobacterales bacterium]|nr:hypothetical protein [Solirubrobacterales bacterium]